MSNVKVFVCAPYRGHIERNVRMAKRICRLVSEVGCKAFAPHLKYARLSQISVGCLKRCDVMVVIGEPSFGMCSEIYLAEELGIPILYFEGSKQFEELYLVNSTHVTEVCCN